MRFSLLSLAFCVVLWFQYKVSRSLLVACLLITCVLAFVWWRDVIREGLLGYHTSKLELSFRFGMMLFILSEVFFFFSFFLGFL